MPPTANLSPSSNSRSNWLPSRWNSVPALKILPKTFCTTLMFGADAEPAAELLLEVGRRREMVGVDMGLEDPLDLELLLPHMGDDGVGRVMIGAARCRIVVEHRIDDGAVLRCRIDYDIAERVGRLVEERSHFRTHGRLHDY